MIDYIYYLYDNIIYIIILYKINQWSKQTTTIYYNHLKSIKYLKKWNTNKNKIFFKIPTTIDELYCPFIPSK